MGIMFYLDEAVATQVVVLCFRTVLVKGWRMTDYRRKRQSYVSRAGGDEGGQG